jgi:hypothetical protein
MIDYSMSADDDNKEPHFSKTLALSFAMALCGAVGAEVGRWAVDTIRTKLQPAKEEPKE